MTGLMILMNGSLIRSSVLIFAGWSDPRTNTKKLAHQSDPAMQPNGGGASYTIPNMHTCTHPNILCS